ncbi:MAG: hypothetical protein K6F51_05895 [Acetatifactor sp.]|nr:hypothetical protein [Acetatifactor sp.]
MRENIELEVAKIEENEIDMVTMFDDCESGFLAKNEYLIGKIVEWILS